MKYIKSFESLRDKMTPKSMDDISGALVHRMNKDKHRGYFDPNDWGLTLVDYDENGGMNDYCDVIFKSEDGRRWQITIDDREYFPIIVREKKRGVSGVGCKTYDCVEEYFTKKGLIKRINESLRAKMTPKLPDDVRKQYSNLIFWKLLIDGRLTDEQEKYMRYHDFYTEKAKEVGITDVPNTKWKKELVLYLNMLKLFSNINDDFIFGLHRIAGSIDHNTQQAALYIGIRNFVERKYQEENIKFKENMGSYLMNESLRDRMTPKSTSDIEKEIEGKNRLTVFEDACEAGATDYVRKKVKYYPKVWLGSCLRRAAGNGHLDVVKILVENGADVNYNNDVALKYAARDNHYDVVEYLLENGADVNYNNGEWFRLRDEKMLDIFQKHRDK